MRSSYSKRLDRKRGEREEIERLLDQVNSALDLLDPNEKD
jgi:hypothetical protein